MSLIWYDADDGDIDDVENAYVELDIAIVITGETWST